MTQKLRVTDNFLKRAAAEFGRYAKESGHTEFRDCAYWFYASGDGAMRVFHEYRNSHKAGVGYDAVRGSYYFKLETPHFEGEAVGEKQTQPTPQEEAVFSGPMVQTVVEIERELASSGLEGEEYLQRAKELLDASGYKMTDKPCACSNGGTHGHHFACGYSVPTYYSVGANKAWTDVPAPLAFFTRRGSSVTESRIHPEGSGILTLRVEGKNVGTLFQRRADQMAYLRSKGWLEAETPSVELPKPVSRTATTARH